MRCMMFEIRVSIFSFDVTCHNNFPFYDWAMRTTMFKYTSNLILWVMSFHYFLPPLSPQDIRSA